MTSAHLHSRRVRRPHVPRRRRGVALLVARQVPRRPRTSMFTVHLLNTGSEPARAASWRVQRTHGGSPHVTALATVMPSRVEPGADIEIATITCTPGRQATVDIVVRWVQVGGVVDESTLTLTPWTREAI